MRRSGSQAIAALAIVLCIALLSPPAAFGILSNLPATPPAPVAAASPDPGATAVFDPARPDFTLVVLPDSQNYTASLHGGSPGIFRRQMDWIVRNRREHNIAFVVHVGDIVEHGAQAEEWENASAAFAMLERAGIPYSLAFGNHDATQVVFTTDLYETFFGVARFAARPGYGGHYGTDNYNHYDFFTAAGLDFLVLSLGYRGSPEPAVLRWANALLRANAHRRAIVLTHSLIVDGDPGEWTTEGWPVYEALRENPNLFLMLCGHNEEFGLRADPPTGHTVYTILSDTQAHELGGEGWLRLLTFRTDNSTLHVQTFSPVLNRFNADSRADFVLPFDAAPQ